MSDMFSLILMYEIMHMSYHFQAVYFIVFYNKQVYEQHQRAIPRLSIDLASLESGQVSGSTRFKSIYRNKRGGA